MRRAQTRILFLSVLTAAALVLSSSDARTFDAQPPVDLTRIVSVSVEPATVELVGPRALRGLLVHGVRDDGRIVDLTRVADYQSTAPEFLVVTDDGVVMSAADGSGQVVIDVAGRKLSVGVRVTDSLAPRDFHFERDIEPILSKYSCNGSGCHGKAEGQNGFKLSVFGFDSQADYNALTKEARGRRTFVGDASRSLLLTKATGQVPHGGGVRLALGSPEYNKIRDWIAAGVPIGDPEAPRVARIEIHPAERILDFSAEQQLRVIAHYSNGRTEDVTAIARYQSNNEGLADVDESGLVLVGEAPGQVAVMATYMGAVDTFQALIPRSETIAEYPRLAERNFIDTLVHAKLRKLNIVPSGRSSDAEFLRRIYLDVIGTLPTAAEARRFLDDQRPDKRDMLVSELLKRPEYADYWALKWADLLRVDRRTLGQKNAYAYYQWIRGSFAENKPVDRFVDEILTLSGRTKDSPQVNFYRAVGGAKKLTDTVAQVFLGIRIECAQCHHHPFDRWSQTDYYGMTAFFQQVKRAGTSRGEIMTAAGDPQTKHPRSGETIFAHALGEPMPEASPPGDRRRVLSDWMTAADNQWFARNSVNRVWAHMMGRGLVVPVDDFRATNPPTNPELLDALAKHFVDHQFDLHDLIHTIASSEAYQRTSRPNETNAQDEQNYSRALFKRMDAEVLFDALCQVTGRDEKFTAVPHGYRAIQLWDSEVDHYFLKLFGRPTRKTACDCERNSEPTVGQVLHVLNAPAIHGKLAHEGGRINQLVKRHSADERLVEELYLTFFGRLPDDSETSSAVQYIRQNGDRREASEDLAWSLMNSLEFVFNH
ncbi:MAG: DUF1549 and DUF1553 domain-containing protein [Pirellulaceae bacterium]|jgi:hypothetical protein|nr:DUF1549 and DUF1553 domain-containing protein [Pirellulaceae bacterium]